MLTVVHILTIKLYITLLAKINNVYQVFCLLRDKSFLTYVLKKLQKYISDIVMNFINAFGGKLHE